MRGRIVLGALAAGLTFGAGAGAAAAKTPASDCSAPATVQTRSMLFFGMSRPKGGMVSEDQWQAFLKDEVTPRFPDGLTVLDGRGQWRGPRGVIDREPSKVVIIEHPETAAARRKVEQLIAAYKKAFEQEAVLWEREQVCAAFR
jgi:hypothetical protein